MPSQAGPSLGKELARRPSARGAAMNETGGPTTLTAEQRISVAARGFHIALSAGAGCGKTTVLTDRFVSLLDDRDRIRLDRIVALTFTEKAARELRDRVRRACRARLDEGKDPAYWISIVRDLEAA